MSQRQLAQQSGVDHSTISRLVGGDRMPSLSTATKLAHGLREVHDQADPPRYLELFSSGSTNPTARVWYALGADESLSEVHARQIMEHYLALRGTIESVPGHPIPAATATAARLEGTRTSLGRP